LTFKRPGKTPEMRKNGHLLSYPFQYLCLLWIGMLTHHPRPFAIMLMKLSSTKRVRISEKQRTWIAQPIPAKHAI
jgi:hypothetical protein